MTDLIHQRQWGDITFGMPTDVALLNQPYGFYQFLGVPRDASREVLQRAYHQRARQLHPDQGGSEADFKNLQRVADILFDDGGELGEEHSQRRHYDHVSSLDDYFEGFITVGDQRTEKLSEIILKHLQVERRYAEAEQDITQKFPEFAELQEQLKQPSSRERKEAILEELKDLSAKAAGLTPEQRQEVDQMREEARQRFENEQRAFVGRYRSSPQKYWKKVLDLFYVGNSNSSPYFSDVTFAADRSTFQLGLVAQEESDQVLKLIAGGTCRLFGFSQVHFKAEEANVAIIDPHLTGIIQVVKGSVKVDYNYTASSYGNVIRARGPTVTMVQGFIQRGDVFVPPRFAEGEWWERKPALDIAVKEGTIRLNLTSPVFHPTTSGGYDYREIPSSLERFISNNSLYPIIKQKYR